MLQLRDNIVGGDFKRRPGKPYMKYRELMVFNQIVEKLQPKNILEWGSGYSTIYFPKKLGKGYKWLSIENNEEWASQIKETSKDKGVTIELIKENAGPPYSDEFRDGSYEDFKDYIEKPGSRAPFDYIVIDGRARRACLQKSFSYLKEGGVVILHDANRNHYIDETIPFTDTFLLQDYRRSGGGMLIATKSIKIDSLINSKSHKRNWGLISNLIGKLLSL